MKVPKDPPPNDFEEETHKLYQGDIDSINPEMRLPMRQKEGLQS